MNKCFEIHLFVIWDNGRRVAERRVLADIRRRFQVVFAGEVSFPCAAREGYCRFYGARSRVLVEKAKACGDGPFLVVVVRVSELQRVVDQDGKLVNALMFSCKKTYRRWCGGFFRVHGTLQPSEFERDIYKLTGHSASEWERGVPSEVHMELPDLESLPVSGEGCGASNGYDSAKRSKGTAARAVVRTAVAVIPFRRLRRRVCRWLTNFVFGTSVRRKASKVGSGLKISGPCAVTRQTCIGNGVSIGGMSVFGGGEFAICDNVHFGADVNVITKDHPCKTAEAQQDKGYARTGVVIDDFALIGSRTTILPGTHVGKGAIVQTGAVVHGHVPDFAIYGGIPSRILARREVGVGSKEGEQSLWKVFAAVTSLVDARDLDFIVDRHNGPLHRCVLSGTWHGNPCIVKWTDNAPVSIANEYEVGKAFYEASCGHAPKMYSFVSNKGRGTVCVMERMSGTDLMSFLSGLPDGDRRITDIAEQIVELFDVMRRIGMCHRDLHPRNIFVDSNGVVKFFDFQNSALSSRKEDPYSHAHDVSRKFIYECKSPHKQVVGLYNDCEHLLARLGDSSPLRRELLRLWRDGARDFDYYCPVGAYHAARFAFRSVGVVFRTWFCKKSELDKLREKLAVTWPTLRYWIRHGVTGRSGFVAGKGRRNDHVG